MCEYQQGFSGQDRSPFGITGETGFCYNNPFAGFFVDILKRFVFDGTDIRGEWVSLDQGFLDLLSRADYPDFACELLGEFLAAGVILAGSLKFDGRLVLQAKSEGPVSLVMAEADSKRNYRGYIQASGIPDLANAAFSERLRKGILAITIEPEKGERYQGIVPLDGASLSQSLEHYFTQSEQLNTRLFLAVNQQGAKGLMLQQLPVQQVPDEEERAGQWQHVCYLADTLKKEELTDLPCEELLYRLYHQENVRMLDQRPVHFHCPCSHERVSAMLLSLGREELESILEEQGQIEVACEFCQRQYRFVSADVASLFGDTGHNAIH